jgi:tetratricopeptide (TPR) repeat protein
MKTSANATASKQMIKRIAGLIIVMVISSSFIWAQDRAKIERWTVEADTLMNRQDFNGALKLLNKIIVESKLKTDDDYLSLYNRALCYFSLARYEEALKDVNQYLAKFREEHAQLLRLYIYQEKGDYENQLKDLNQLIADHPDNPELIQWRIGAMMEKGKYADARKDVKTLLAIQEGPELKSYLGLTYYYDNKPDSALMVFDEVIKRYPAFPETYLYAGSMCIEQEAYELGLQYIDKGLTVNPSDLTLQYYKGVALVELERIAEGCRCLTKAFKSGFDDAVDYLKQYCYGIED